MGAKLKANNVFSLEQFFNNSPHMIGRQILLYGSDLNHLLIHILY